MGKEITQAEIFAYQDGAYDALKQLPARIAACRCKTDVEVVLLIAKTLRQMEEMSTRKLGLQSAEGGSKDD